MDLDKEIEKCILPLALLDLKPKHRLFIETAIKKNIEQLIHNIESVSSDQGQLPAYCRYTLDGLQFEQRCSIVNSKLDLAQSDGLKMQRSENVRHEHVATQIQPIEKHKSSA